MWVDVARAVLSTGVRLEADTSSLVSFKNKGTWTEFGYGVPLRRCKTEANTAAVGPLVCTQQGHISHVGRQLDPHQQHLLCHGRPFPQRVHVQGPLQKLAMLALVTLG